MTEYCDLDWLDRDSNQIEGLDQLGIQAISIAMYAKLLPGITNVTDRARYFSFYSWLLLQYDPEKNGDWCTFIRKHEFVLSLASNYAIHKGNVNIAYDGGAVVGSDKAKDALAGIISNEVENISLELYTALDVRKRQGAPGSYFKNKEGGYDQYYKRQLNILRLTQESTERGFPDCDLISQTGVPLAKSLASHNGFKELNRIALKENINKKDLNKIFDSVPPWNITNGSEEEELLINNLFGFSNEAQGLQNESELSARRNSLVLILSFLDAGANENTIEDFLSEFRWCNMFRCLPNGSQWQLNGNLHATRDLWASYQLQDIVNYTLECYLWSIIEALDNYKAWSNEIDILVQEMINVVKKDFFTCKLLPGREKQKSIFQLNEYLSYCSRTPDEDKRSPFSLYSDRSIFETLEESEDIEETLILTTHLFFRLLSRINETVYQNIDLDINFFRRYPVNLRLLGGKVIEMKNEPVETFLEFIIKELIIKRHLKIATRKLSQQGQSTFKFIPEAGKLILTAEKPFGPTLTSPRLKQAIRILCDIHLITLDDKGMRLSSRGKKIIKEYHALQTAS